MGRVNDRLTYAPKQFGDPQYTYPHAKIRVYRAWTELLDVSYGVHTEQPVVFVRDIRPRDDRPLGMANSSE